MKNDFLYTDLVLKFLSSSDDNAKIEISKALEDQLIDIKYIAITFGE